LSRRKRAAKMLIAQRAFLSLTFIQAALHGVHSSVRFRFFKIQSYYSLFLRFFVFTLHLSTYD